MEKKLKVVPPTMPNFIRFEQPGGLRQDGFKTAEGFDIANLTKEEAEEFAKLMHDSFLDHWTKRRQSKL